MQATRSCVIFIITLVILLGENLPSCFCRKFFYPNTRRQDVRSEQNNKKKRRVHYQLSYQVNIPWEVTNQKYKKIKQPQPQLSCVCIPSQYFLSEILSDILQSDALARMSGGGGGGGMTQPPRLQRFASLM